jgi:hypothetical protein
MARSPDSDRTGNGIGAAIGTSFMAAIARS